MAITTRGEKPPAATAILFANSSTNISQPTTELADSGYAENSRPGSANYNWLYNYVTAGVTHCFVYGIPVYDSTETYNAYSFVNYNGVIYKSLQASNTGNEPDTATTYWEGLNATTADMCTGNSGLTYLEAECTDLELTYDETDIYLPEKIQEAERAFTGFIDMGFIEADPVAFDDARTTTNPSYDKYCPHIPIYDANHDVTTTQVCALDVAKFRSQLWKVGNDETYEFSCTLASGVLTMPTSDAGVAMVTAIIANAMVSQWYASGEDADYASSGGLYTGYRQMCARISDTDYAITDASISANTITLDTYPSDGTVTVSFPIFAIAGSTTSFRLRRVSGAAPFAVNDYSGEIMSASVIMDRFQGFGISIPVRTNATAFGASQIATENGSGTLTVDESSSLIDSGYGTLRYDKTTRSMSFGVYPYVKVRGLLATGWTSNND